MKVPKRKSKLHEQREQRQPRAELEVLSNQDHAERPIAPLRQPPICYIITGKADVDVNSKASRF
jgi:hypothetical protein